MQPICDDALNEWKSLYTEEIQKVWSTEKKELRRVSMVFYVLKQEFARIESSLTREISNFKEKVEIIDNYKKSNLSASPEQCAEEPLQTQTHNTEESSLKKSPKLNKHRRRPQIKIPLHSLSLLKIQNKSGSSITVPKIYDKPESEELFDSSACDNSLDRDASEDSSADNKSYVFKTPQGIKRLANADVVDSSFVVEDTPNKYIDKKFKWTRKHSSKTASDKRKKSYTLTQMFDNFQSQKTKLNSASSNKSRNAKQATTAQSKLEDGNLDDETFIRIDDEIPEDITNKNLQVKENIPILTSIFKDYEKIPAVKDKCLQHVHKTVFRTKVNRAGRNKSRNSKEAATVHRKLKDSNLGDETIIRIDDEISEDITNKYVQLKEKNPIPNSFFKDYDKIPELKKTSPQHVHKTEAVRRKTDRMKLPGWSCSDCEQYYKGLNLPAEELRKKMNMCSKHRNKFPLLDTTRKGFWDVDMPPTQEDQQNDTSLLNF